MYVSRPIGRRPRGFLRERGEEGKEGRKVSNHAARQSAANQLSHRRSRTRLDLIYLSRCRAKVDLPTKYV